MHADTLLFVSLFLELIKLNIKLIFFSFLITIKIVKKKKKNKLKKPPWQAKKKNNYLIF